MIIQLISCKCDVNIIDMVADLDSLSYLQINLYIKNYIGILFY